MKPFGHPCEYLVNCVDAGYPQLKVIDRNSLQLLSMDSDVRDVEIGQICFLVKVRALERFGDKS